MLEFIGLILFGIISVITGGIVALKKQNSPQYIIKPPVTLLDPEDEDHPNIIIKSEDQNLYKKFIKEYDLDGNFKFNNVNYRKGAKNTCSFGISEGFKYDKKGNMNWGYVRLHTGVDRARGATFKEINDIVMVPFKFDESSIIEYKDKNGKWYSYGTLILLYNNEYKFQMRIAHMDPNKDIIPWSYKRLKNCQSFNQNWLLGSAGTCGASSGNHTHTEIISLDNSCEVFDILLQEKYGEKSLIEYSKSDILREYKKYKHFKNASNSVILKDWQAVKAHRGATFVNKYKYSFTNKYGNKFTRYASNLLFGGL